ARSLEIFSIYEKVREANSPAFSINGNCMGSFNEPSTVACMLMVQGYEVYVGKSTRFVGGINIDQLLKAKREYEYVDFAEMLSLA
ncbi:hypothetical protein, partial [Streptococcus pseudopneumoniae]|uniref:hypothetical protein n=1 Tax=Streptococcus pseudopneumoniae TaxID=257758 RepID=UPI0019D502EB